MTMTAYGIDIASWQHPGGAPIDWAEVRAAGKTRVYIKATEGTGYANPYFAADAADAHAAGLEVGAYHFAHPAQPVAAQLAHFRQVCAGVAGDLALPPLLDLEVTDGRRWGSVASWAQAWLTGAGADSIVYVNRSYRGALESFGFPWGHPVDLAEGGAHDPAAIEQTGQGPVPGIQGAVDLDTWTGAAPVASSPAPNPPPGTNHPPAPAPSPQNWTQKDIAMLPELRQGQTGQHVRILQGLCCANGRPVAVDGIFGPKTHSAVTNFQGAVHIAVDGIVGPVTWTHLLCV